MLLLMEDKEALHRNTGSNARSMDESSLGTQNHPFLLKSSQSAAAQQLRGFRIFHVFSNPGVFSR